MRNQEIGDRQTVLVPMNFRHIPITRLSDERDDESPMQVYKPGDNEFLELVHVALRLRSDILALKNAEEFVCKLYNVKNVSSTDAASNTCII